MEDANVQIIKNKFCPNILVEDGNISVGEFNNIEEANAFPIQEIWCINRRDDNKFNAYKNQGSRILIICSWNRNDNDSLKYVLTLVHPNGKIHYWDMNDLPLYPEQRKQQYECGLGDKITNTLHQIAANQTEQIDNKQNLNCNKDMKRTNKIRLTESQLHRVIKESVKKVMKEGKGKFTQLYNDTKSPHNYSKTIESLLNEYIAVENEYQRKMLNIEKDLEMYTNWSWDEFCEYAEEKYGLTRDNMEKNWDKFAPDTFEFRTRVH